MKIIVGARASPLSRIQVDEVYLALQAFHNNVIFEKVYVETYGDKDRTTSLRSLDKTDFFTREIDGMLLSHQCRVAIHSAKDLPEPLPEGLQIVALTKAIDSSDSLVLREGETIETLPTGAMIATSSERREAAVSKLRSDLKYVDIRGTIQERLSGLISGQADGVVIAEAALIRLKLTHLNRIRLPGDTVPYQGQLAIMTRDDDQEMKQLFSCLDSR